MAIVALILALVICIPFLPALVAIVLAIVVLVANKPGKGLAITAIVISLLASAAWIGLFAAIGSGDFDDVFDDLLPVEQLATGECLNASNLADDSEDFVEDIEEVTCDGPHDAEVLATKELTQDDAEGYGRSRARSAPTSSPKPGWQTSSRPEIWATSASRPSRSLTPATSWCASPTGSTAPSSTRRSSWL